MVRITLTEPPVGKRKQYDKQGEEMTAIKDIKTDGIIGEAYYSLDGRRLKSPQKGINIIRKSDGTTKKRIVK